MKVIDNFLSYTDFQYIKNTVVESIDFPWFYSKVIDHKTTGKYSKIDCEDIYNYQLAHMLYNNNLKNSEFYNILFPLIDELKIDSLVKAKLNFNPRCEKIVEHGMHCDYPFKCLTAVYYLNTNNGYTKFQTGEMTESIENRIVVFSSDTMHTGTTCTDKQGRYVMNINFFAEEFLI
jgi:hypothetical protein